VTALLWRELIEEIIRRAKLFEDLIAKSRNFPVKTDELIRVRIV
jgi:hypothetical protein